MKIYFNEPLFTDRAKCTYRQKEILEFIQKNGVTLYPEDMEELLHLRPDTLKVEEKVVPILQLRKK